MSGEVGGGGGRRVAPILSLSLQMISSAFTTARVRGRAASPATGKTGLGTVAHRQQFVKLVEEWKVRTVRRKKAQWFAGNAGWLRARRLIRCGKKFIVDGGQEVDQI